MALLNIGNIGTRVRFATETFMLCEICEDRPAEFQGWFYPIDRDNEFVIGTVSYHLCHNLVVCKPCAEQAIKDGRCKAKELPV